MKKILIVDDEAMARRIVSKTLIKAGYEVEQASNGEEAWSSLCKANPDMMITDIDMPRMSGEQLCKKITSEITDRAWPIIVVTSKTALEHRTWAHQMNNVSFLEKPLSLRKLIEKIAPMFESTAVEEEVVK
ncbi:MAG: response regulator [Gammaproteobacteria bacterium]